jgi:heme-degrading monooxygenase HmoA
MIARSWRGWALAAEAHHYEGHYRSEVLPALSRVPGFRGARLLRRSAGDEVEFCSLTFFEDLDAIRAFAGADHEAAVVATAARAVLVRFDDRVAHYEVSETLDSQAG